MNPHSHERVQLLLNVGRPADAEREVREALAADPNDAWLHCLLSHAERQQSHIPSAVDSARTAIALAPDFAFAHSTLGWAFMSSRWFNDAAESFETSVRLEPTPEAYQGWAEALLSLSQGSNAASFARLGLELDPRHIGCLCTLACCHADLGRLDLAVAALRRALEINPRESHTHALLGWCHLCKWRLFRAVGHYLEALQLDPRPDQSRAGFRATLDCLSFLTVWCVFACLVLVLVALAVSLSGPEGPDWFAPWFGASVAILAPLAAMSFVPRYRDILAFQFFRRLRAFLTPEDRRLGRHLFFAISTTWVANAVVAATVPPSAPKIAPYFAAAAFPIAPFIIRLGSRSNALTVVFAGIQSSMILSLYTKAPQTGPALYATIAALVAIVVTSNLDPE